MHERINTGAARLRVPPFGAGAGAIVGGVAGGGKGAVIGGAAGAGAGYLIGRHKDRKHGHVYR